MARRKARIPQGKKIQPAVKTLTFDLPSAPEQTNLYIDLSQCASIMNRRFYRQGLNWAVAGFTWYTVADGAMRINKIPDTWIASNAWEKGFRAWQKMNNEALEESESVKPKFLDFKVFMNADHHSSGVANNLLPRIGSNIGTPVTPGEWEYSKYHIPNTAVDSSDPTSNNPRDIIWTGANYQGAGASGDFAVSLIEGYAASRGLPDIQDPNTPDDASSVNGSLAQNWLAALDNDFDQQTGEVLTDMITENNQAPYPFENDGVHTDTMYPGGANQASGLQEASIAFVTPTTLGGRTSIPGENFQGGLINVELEHIGTSVLQVHLVAGHHRGYLAESMQDV